MKIHCNVIAAAALVSVVSVCPAHASDFKTGNQLMSDCQSPEPVDRMICMGYVEGVAGAMAMNAVNGFRACISTTATALQVTDIATAFIYANPARRHYAATGLVAQSLEAAFPCGRASGPKLNS